MIFAKLLSLHNLSLYCFAVVVKIVVSVVLVAIAIIIGVIICIIYRKQILERIRNSRPST